jgi:hypothetical protein
MTHDRRGLAVGGWLSTEALMILAGLRNQRLSSLDDGGSASSDGNLAVIGEQVRVLLGVPRSCTMPYRSVSSRISVRSAMACMESAAMTPDEAVRISRVKKILKVGILIGALLE